MIQLNENFTVPAYFPKFSCKCGACRHTCCQGLAIRISQEEYFRMVGEECPSDVRTDLDLALHTLGRGADPGRYAELSPDFTGRCRLLGKDGLCRLQAACGAQAISVVCRLYPRRPQFLNSQRDAGLTLPVPEIGTVNACEATLELLRDFQGGNPMQLTARAVSFDLADLPKKEERPDLRHALQVHRLCVGILAEEQLPLAERLRRLVTFLQIAFSDDKAGLQCIDEAVSMPAGLVVKRLKQCAENREDLEEAVQTCRESGDYRPLHKIESTFLGRVLANDAFVRLFPYGDPEIAPLRAGAAFVMMARMLLMLTERAGGAESEEGVSRMAAFFRMVELTDFDEAILDRLKY
ncbi:MAG: flagellin lysine-N-methylase [Lachnospiraceae bacterium]|jgi:hypothetical protein|nr:flagellin lysine-N-methylase [Lachnospiraceae bacterium]MCH4071082.1 flagellin lysine-N-methylase [Lachnospiraceae bacterium]MCH4108153.1 flagellin lysine-N-methylase [Lachnospiraceae bacterium]MCI1302855.1 flagellin lysine-N-methylase [Lachnospiraceae bacterium]MCI1332104.1 flagellin lysine-N-methylase [Lachnospiraceae bacterium]